MKGLSRTDLEAVLHKLPVLGVGGSFEDHVAPVADIIEEDMSDMLHVDSDLMSAPCFQHTLDQSHITVTFQWIIMGDGMLALV